MRCRSVVGRATFGGPYRLRSEASQTATRPCTALHCNCNCSCNCSALHCTALLCTITAAALLPLHCCHCIAATALLLPLHCTALLPTALHCTHPHRRWSMCGGGSRSARRHQTGAGGGLRKKERRAESTVGRSISACEAVSRNSESLPPSGAAAGTAARALPTFRLCSLLSTLRGGLSIDAQLHFGTLGPPAGMAARGRAWQGQGGAVRSGGCIGELQRQLSSLPAFTAAAGLGRRSRPPCLPGLLAGKTQGRLLTHPGMRQLSTNCACSFPLLWMPPLAALPSGG